MKTTRYTAILALPLLIFSIIYGHTYAQDMVRIPHLRGTKIFNGIQVKVTSKGKVDSLHYCGADTGPFYIGYNYGNTGAGDGSYTFTFSQPVNEVMINFSALSHSSNSYNEEARIYINGQHYKIKQLGTQNSCGEGLCILTPNGDLRPCMECGGSGTSGIRIKGPVSTLTVECKIIMGEPMGFVAGVWFGGKATNQETLTSYTATLGDNAAGMGKELVLEGNLGNAEIRIKDSQGKPITLSYRSIESNRIVLDFTDVPAGEYLLEIEQDGQIEKQKLFIQ